MFSQASLPSSTLALASHRRCTLSVDSICRQFDRPVFGQGALPSAIGVDKSLMLPVNEGVVVTSKGLTHTLEDEPS